MDSHKPGSVDKESEETKFWFARSIAGGRRSYSGNTTATTIRESVTESIHKIKSLITGCVTLKHNCNQTFSDSAGYAISMLELS